MIVDMTEAKYVEISGRIKQKNEPLLVLNEDDRDTIYNVIIIGEDTENNNGEQ